MICEKCQLELQIGMFPFCKGQPSDHLGGSYNAQGDEIDFWAENAWREPRHFTSQKEYERALAADGMELKPHYVPGSKHLSNWATMDPYTLENGRILAERQAQTKASADPSVTLESLKWTVSTHTGFGYGDEVRTGDL